MRNRCGSMKGSDDRRQCATHHPRKTTVAAQAAPMPGECQPQSFTLTIAKTKDATPVVTSSAAPKSGCEPLRPGILGSFRQPTTKVISPIGRLTRKIQRPAHRDQNPADERPERRRDAAGSRPRPYGAAPALRGRRITAAHAMSASLARRLPPARHEKPRASQYGWQPQTRLKLR
jgi:hypothetical protein